MTLTCYNMCGITGIISERHLQAIEPMTRALSHRGPDGEGFYRDTHAALGHRRLSIIDLDGGRQPISNPSDTLHLICNGEIYNSPELHSRFEREGYRFRTHTDVEVILPLYARYGADCVKHLRGMFAFAIWDSQRQTVLLARDHLGQKPLFYCETDGALLFASEPKAILASSLLAPEMDLEALWHYISLRYMPDAYSMFKGIRKLPAATTLEWSQGRTQLTRYWSPNFRNKLACSEREMEDQLDELLQETVRGHLLSDVRVGTFLSGGIDSSTVAAVMATVSTEPVPSFSIGVEEHQFNELPYAHAVAAKYGMEEHTRVVRADLIHLMPAMVHHMDEPSDPFGVGIYLASQLAREQVKVVLCGDGGDENFAGYDRFAGQRLASYYSLLPASLRRQVISRMVRFIPESFGYKSLQQKALWLNEMSFHSAGDRYAQSLCFLRFMPELKEQLFTPGARAKIADDHSIGKILACFDAENAEHLVDRMLYTDLVTRMPDHLLAIVDRMSMAHSLEARPPLIDVKVVELAAAIPASFKLKGMRLKHILKTVAARYLPPDLINRKKQGLAFPLGKWMREDLRGFMSRLFADSRMVQVGIFQQQCIDRLLSEHLAGRTDHSYRLWILINLEIWHRLNIEQQTLSSLRELTDRLRAA